MKTTPTFVVREIDDNNSVPYIIFFAATASHSESSSRLTASIKKFGLPFISVEIPTIHRSVSPRGTDDPTYCKANLISAVMADLKRPILYLDADIIVEARPFLIDYLCAEDYDFGIFNWLTLPTNQAYKPTGSSASGVTVFRFSHAVDAISRTQLVCSGAVQYWGCSDVSIELLSHWRDCVIANPGCPDDHSLDYAFNNLPFADKLKTYWLPRAYIRYAWWVFDKPVLNHPDYPNPGVGFTELAEFRGRPRIHMDRLLPRILTGQEQTLRSNSFVVAPDGAPQLV